MSSGRAHHIHVEPYRIEKSRVLFSWRVQPESDLFRRHDIYFEYPDIDLREIPGQVWYAMLFAHLAKAADETGLPWVFHFPVRVEMAHVLPWAEYLQLQHVRIDRRSLIDAPMPASPVSSGSDTPIGILLGGGKDSMFALALLSEVYGREQVTPIMMAHAPGGPHKHRRRHEAQLVAPLKEHTGRATRYLASSVRQCFRTRESSRKAGLALYFATLLPYWLTGRLNTVLFSYEFTLLAISQRGGAPEFLYADASFERIQRLAAQLRRSYSIPVRITNINASVSKHVAFRVLAKRYPDYFRALFMCEAVFDKDAKWCGQCWKCFEYVMMCLVERVPCAIDISRYMAEARYIDKVFAAARSLQVHPETGNLRWSPDFGGHEVHYGTLCHSFSRLDLEYAGSVVDAEALARLAQLKAWFGNREFPLFDSYLPAVLERTGLAKAGEIASVLEAYCKPAADPDAPILLADDWASLRSDLSYEVVPYGYDDIATRPARGLLTRLLEKGSGKLLGSLRKAARAVPGAK